MWRVTSIKRIFLSLFELKVRVQWLIKGQHVYLKQFSYIFKNKYNKICFLQNIKNLWGPKTKTAKRKNIII